MVDMAAIASAAGALKTAFDLSKTALNLRDASMIKAKVTEMQGEISSALASAPVRAHARAGHRGHFVC